MPDPKKTFAPAPKPAAKPVAKPALKQYKCDAVIVNNKGEAKKVEVACNARAKQGYRLVGIVDTPPESRGNVLIFEK